MGEDNDEGGGRPLSFAKGARKREEARAARGLARARAGMGRERFWRSDGPINPERWRFAREFKGLTIEQLADEIYSTPEHLRAVEEGREQPDSTELTNMWLATGFRFRWFYNPETPYHFRDAGGLNTLEFHASLTTYVCDPCERAGEGEVEAERRCEACEEDLCGACAIPEKTDKGDWIYLCDRCHRAWARERTKRGKITQQGLWNK